MVWRMVFRIVFAIGGLALIAWLTYYLAADEIAYFTSGKQAVATVEMDRGDVQRNVGRSRRNGRSRTRTYHRYLVSYDGRSSTLETEERHGIGDQIPIQYAERAAGDLVRRAGESNALMVLILGGVGVIYTFSVGRNLFAQPKARSLLK